ncbi:MAG: hypothetical protein N3D80_14900 [Ignavibacterium album]|nr:hypothetical protein [Ignavibacterium album]MCX8107150.1 hypothetical protein [Ignavibacterium album]
MKNSEENERTDTQIENDEVKKINRLVALIVFFLLLLVLVILFM